MQTESPMPNNEMEDSLCLEPIYVENTALEIGKVLN